MECGLIGAKMTPLISLYTIGPPADKEQAVDPVGVDKINPSH